MPRRLVVAVMAAMFLPVMAAPSFATAVLWSRGWGFFAENLGDWSTVGDFNGDGFNDFLYSVNEGPNGSMVTHLLLGAPYDELFTDLTFNVDRSNLSDVGDLNADGFDEILIPEQGQILILRGSAIPDLTPDVSGPWSGSRAIVRGVGDLNADGYDDFAIGDPLDSQGNAARGRVLVYFGGSGFDALPDLTIDGASDGESFGSALAGRRDFNGDGFVDLVVGAPNADASGSPDAGEVRIFHGGPGFDGAPDQILHGSSAGASLGVSLDLLADFDGDGSSDLVVQAAQPGPDHHRISVFRGGPAYVGTAFWGFDDPNVGSVRAGDDVNRDHLSDILVSEKLFTTRGSRVYFGGNASDTLADAPLSYELTPYHGGSTAPAGDVNGDGYQDWFIETFYGGMYPTHAVHLLTARTDLDVIEVHSPVLAGAPARLDWYGSDIVNVLYSHGGGVWQTLASGVGGQSWNSATVVLPPGGTRTARLRVVSVANDSLFASLDPFFVPDSLEVQCASATALASGVGLSWRVQWTGYPQGSEAYRLYRDDGGFETMVGPDTILSNGIRDDGGVASSQYRLVAVLAGGVERTLDTIQVGSPPCDSLRIQRPNAQDTWQIPAAPYTLWEASRGPFDVWLSLDDGVTWMSLASSDPNPGLTHWGSAAIPAWTDNARVRVALHDAPWIEAVSERFQIRGLHVERIAAAPHAAGGTLVTWSVTFPPVVSFTPDYLEMKYGVLSLVRVEPTGAVVLVGTRPLVQGSGSWADAGGSADAQYRLVLECQGRTAVIAATAVGTSGPAPGSLRLMPSPARRASPATVVIPELRRPDGQIANDLDLFVFDLGGRQVARVANDLEARSSVLQWTPAGSGLHSGVYWLRARSNSAGYSGTFRFAIVD